MTSDPGTQTGEAIALREALEREAATREILEVISQSRADERPVFDVIIENAARLCQAPFAGLYLVDDARTHATLVSSLGARSEYLAAATKQWPLDNPASVPSAIARRCVVHIADIKETDIYRSGDRRRVDAVDIEGIRTFLAVPLLHDGTAIGCIGLYRREVRGFEESQIALVETFAAQAVIAIENVRQFRELQTRLEREAATREVLQVISRSRDDEKPVFDAILENASRLCNAPLAFLSMANEERTHVTVPAHRGARSGFAAVLDDFRLPIGGSKLVAVRPITECQVIRIDDIADTEMYRDRDPYRVAMVEDEGIRSLLAVPLIGGGEGIGAIVLYRREVAPFSDDDVALAESFAAQAVIAVENVKQFREVQTRLEREKASAAVLRIISSSTSEIQPVFDMIARNATDLCRAASCSLWRIEGGSIHYCAGHGLDEKVFLEVQATKPVPLADNTIIGQVARTRNVVRIEDAMSEDYRDHEWARALGFRKMIGVPVIVGDDVWGSINLMWPASQEPQDAHIQLVEMFADQASIAIENARLFKALERLNAELGERVQAQVGEIERMGRLKRFLPAAVADAVVSSGSERMLASHRALLGVLFCDIRGFTAFCETAEPEETIEVLQTYHEEMGKLIEAHGAGVDHRSGDGIMVIFNDPFPCDSPAEHAVRLALAMQARMSGLCAEWRKLGHRLGFGVGISLGYATVGVVGSAGRYDYTASGTAVNLAARLCEQAGDGEILLSPRAHQAVESVVVAEPAGALALKGIQAPVEVMRVVRMRDAEARTGAA